jgi:hypothetical protein
LSEQETDCGGFRLLAERICAAYISTQMGFSSIDYVLKKYVRTIGEPPSDIWFQIAAFVGEVMTHAKARPANEPRTDAANETTAPEAPREPTKKRRSKKDTGLEN